MNKKDKFMAMLNQSMAAKPVTPIATKKKKAVKVIAKVTKVIPIKK